MTRQGPQINMHDHKPLHGHPMHKHHAIKNLLNTSKHNPNSTLESALVAEVYLKSCQTSELELFARIINL